MTIKSKLYAETALIGNQWQKDITLNINSAGYIESIETGRDSQAENVDGILIPGMVNCHSHAFQRAFAGFSEYRANPSDSFWSWRDIMYRFVTNMTPNDAYVVARYLYLEMLKAGYTAVAEFHYLHHQSNGQPYDDIAEMSHQIIGAAESTGIGLTLLPVLYTYAGFGHQSPRQQQGRFIHQTEQYCTLVEKLSLLIQKNKTMKLGIAPHSLRAVSQEQLNEVIPYIRKLDPQSPIHIHIAEQQQEVNDCVAHYGQRPVEWLLNNFNPDQNWCLIHATHLNDEEIRKLSQSEAVAGICPTTEANLGDGIFPTQQFLAQGGSLSIGSDSHIAVNVADELRTLEYAQRLIKQQRSILCDDQQTSVGTYLYRHAAQNGALTINQNVGEIAVGKRADFIVLDPNHPNLYAKPVERILDAAIFACEKLPIKNVMVSGKWQVRQGHHDDENQITADYLAVLKKLGQ